MTEIELSETDKQLKKVLDIIDEIPIRDALHVLELARLFLYQEFIGVDVL